MEDKQRFRFAILVGIVAISGFAQGMLLPLIAIIFEKDGLSSTLNGLHATGLYIGVLFISPLLEAPLRKIGYKPIILIGGLAVAVSLGLFPVWKSFWFWFVLRLIIGIGDHILHFGTQTWITSFSPADKRGRNISLYGLFFSLGFAAGPLMTTLVEINEALPFIFSSLICLTAWGFIWFLKNDFPAKSSEDASSFFGTLSRFTRAFKWAWVAFLPPFGYGFMETSLNGNFPVLALRSGLAVSAVSVILPAFAVGSIIFQLPLGIMSDKYGRRKVLVAISLAGSSLYILAGMWRTSAIGLFVCFTLAGMLVGSTFSLGLSYMADLLPRDLLPTGNLLCGIAYSLGSICGPFMGGVTIHYFSGGSFFYMISVLLFSIFMALSIFRPRKIIQTNIT